jgi:hypothetical protein
MPFSITNAIPLPFLASTPVGVIQPFFPIIVMDIFFPALAQNF